MINFTASTTTTTYWPSASLIGWCIFYEPTVEIYDPPSPRTFPFIFLARVYSSSWSARVFSLQVREGQRHRALQVAGCLNLSRKAFHSVTSDSLYTVLILCLAASISPHFLSLTFYRFSRSQTRWHSYAHTLSLSVPKPYLHPAR